MTAADDEATQTVLASIDAAAKKLTGHPDAETVATVLRTTLRILRFMARRSGLADEVLD
jgi:hypothetical protein